MLILSFDLYCYDHILILYQLLQPGLTFLERGNLLSENSNFFTRQMLFILVVFVLLLYLFDMPIFGNQFVLQHLDFIVVALHLQLQVVHSFGFLM